MNSPATDSVPDYAADHLAPVRERLTTTLFIAALFHGIVILGVTFGVGDLGDSGMPAMEVLLLTEPGANDEINPDAAYLAQRNQRGTGTTLDEVKPGSPASSVLPTNLAGIPDGSGVEWKQSLFGAPAVDLVVARGEQSDPSVRHGVDAPSQLAESPLALMYTPPTPVLAVTLDNTLTLRGKIVHEVEVLPDTRESRLAPYLDNWRRKVERLGTVKFPLVARQRNTDANPVLEVVVKADGTVAQVVVRKSSGSKELDQAAITILKLASPFDAFPPALQQDYDQLRFAYEWQFVGNKLRGTVSVAD